jgi:hypothetical protein
VRHVDWSLLQRPTTTQEQRLAAIVGRLAQRTVALRCGETHAKEALGVVPFFDGKPANYTILSSGACSDLSAFVASPRAFDPASCPSLHSRCGSVLLEMTQALETVAHESYHLFGEANEAKVDCWGMQSLWFVAQQLGSPLPEAQALGQWYWRNVYPVRARDLPLYYSPDCRSGGRLDLRPADPRWPG